MVKNLWKVQKIRSPRFSSPLHKRKALSVDWLGSSRNRTFFRCLAIENIIERLACCPGERWTTVVMTWRQSNVTLPNQDVCLSVASFNDNVARSIDRHRWIMPVGLKWFMEGKSVASVNITRWNDAIDATYCMHHWWLNQVASNQL